jgi:hypothetical protein
MRAVCRAHPDDAGQGMKVKGNLVQISRMQLRQCAQALQEVS